MFLIFLAISAALFVAAELLRPKPRFENARPAGLGDFRFPTTTQARKVPIVWGTVKLEGPNLVWYGDLVQEPITVRQKTGLFTSVRQTVGFKYYLGMQMGLCRGVSDSTSAGAVLLQVEINEKVVWTGTSTGGALTINEPSLFGGDELGSGGVVGTLRFHPGTDPQAANAYLTPFQTISGAQPTYQGNAYVVFEGGYVGNSTSLAPWAFTLRRIPNGLSLGTPTVNGGNDANPMNVAFELFTSSEFDIGADVSEIDTANWQAAAATLLTEGNGWSMILDSEMEVEDVLAEIERQIDGVFFRSPSTGKWTVKLARNDYTIGSQPVLDDDTILEIANFARADWEDTTNEVRVEFADRAKSYKDDYATAQDMANALVQGDLTHAGMRIISTTTRYPGIKNAALANQLAWRDLRALSYPLCKASFIVDRSFWDITPGTVAAWTDAARGITQLPMRILRVDYGELRDGRIKLDCVQDVFQFGTGSYGDPPDTGWDEPDLEVDPFPTDEQKAFEAPRAFVYRDPAATTVQDKIWASGRKQGAAVSFEIWERHDSSPPAGAYAEVGEVFSFAKIGSLKSALASGTAVPTTSILIEASPDSQTLLESAFTDNPDIVDQGTNLLNLILVDNEFMLVRAAATSGADVNLQNVYRGVLDSAQASHSAGADVWLIFLGGGLAEGTIPSGQIVDVKLLPKSTGDEVALVDATAITFTMDKRLIRPYPPSRVSLNNVVFNAGTVSLDFLASGAAETTGIDCDFVRRDYRTGEGADEIPPLSTDAASLFTDFPAANSTTVEIQVRNDPAGTNTLLFTETGISAATKDLLRIKILRYTDGAIPSRMRVVLSSRHDHGTDTGLASRQSLTFDFDTASTALSGQHNFGARGQTAASTVYTATENGTYAFTLSSAFSAGDVEYRLNAGSWTALITAGNTTGNIAGVVATDTIEVRHTSADSGALKQLDMNAPGAGQDGYAILYV